jgi:hypothetical protein
MHIFYQARTLCYQEEDATATPFGVAAALGSFCHHQAGLNRPVSSMPMPRTMTSKTTAWPNTEDCTARRPSIITINMSSSLTLDSISHVVACFELIDIH